MTLSLRTTPLLAPGIGAVVADVPVVPVDLGGGREAGAGAAVRVGAEAVQLEAERHRPGNAVEGEVTVEQEVAAVGADAGGAEGHRGVLLDVEEVLAADVVVPGLVPGVHRAEVDGGGDGRLPAGPGRS